MFRFTKFIRKELRLLYVYNTKNRKSLRFLWIVFGVFFFSLLSFVLMIGIGLVGSLKEISISQLKEPKIAQASEVYTSDGEILGQYYFLNRSSVSYEEISPNVIDALISVEDQRFYEHSGIDLPGLFRVFSKTLVLGQKTSGGGSTITQQLAKMFFPREYNLPLHKLVLRKLSEWIIAIKLEYSFTKEEIITFYLNQFDFVNNAVGIKSAAMTYFKKLPHELQIEEAAVLVGMAKNPSLYNPYSRPERAIQRRNVVLKSMLKNNRISSKMYDSLRAQPIKLNFKTLSHKTGTAQYFREYLREYLRKWVNENPKPDGSKYNIYTDGLKIHTTIDSRVQKYAEEGVKKHLKMMQKHFFKHWEGVPDAPFDDTSTVIRKNIMERAIKSTDIYRDLIKKGADEEEIIKVFNTPVKTKLFSWNGTIDSLISPLNAIKYHKHFLHTGVVSIEPNTGKVKAWVGGINYPFFQYDHVRQGKRQVGSVFKPFVYTVAIQEGYSPCYKVPNVPVSVRYKDEIWSPKNSSSAYEGQMISLKKGLALSINTVTAYIMKEFGPEAVVNMAKNMGITSHIPKVPAIALGSADINVFEMAAAYTVFANQGLYIEPIFIEKIVDKYGVEIYRPPQKRKEVLNPTVAYNTINLLEGVVRGGSGSRLRYLYGIKSQIAGKTGTTQNHSDGWFVGIIPKLATAVWVGCEDRISRFRTITYGQGAALALPIWAHMTKSIYADASLGISTKDIFQKPKEARTIGDCYDEKNQAKKKTSVDKDNIEPTHEGDEDNFDGF